MKKVFMRAKHGQHFECNLSINSSKLFT